MTYLRIRIFWMLAAICACCLTTSCQPALKSPPSGFVHIKQVIPDIKYEIRYAGKNNFLGRPVKGYEAPEAFLTHEATVALKLVQAELNKSGYGLKIFDAYRPQRAVNDFVEWARDLSDTINKRAYYPDVPKSELFKRGYIASKSGHTRGSTVDLTVIELKTGRELDMGSPYDFFGQVSHHNYIGITASQKENRKMFKEVMQRHGFNAYASEWWHYTLANEPFPDTYFDFPVTSH